jgi:DMSO/TMAO reductase YedYZ molybdopterin-dependent catalytic subunit
MRQPRRRPQLAPELAGRVPPGQFVSPRWPVLHQGDIPPFDAATWDFRVWGTVSNALDLSWEAFQDLPVITRGGDLHCVTRWSTLDHQWTGVHPRTVLDLAGIAPRARYALLHGESGYTANLPLKTLLGADVVLATHHDGQPLTAAHGAPLRAVIPGRYAWKSVKWLRGIELLSEDKPGFWEGFGYHNNADPWREERFEPED